MALEDLTGTGKFITALNAAWPVDDDWVDEGDNHIRGIKNVLKNTFPHTNGAIAWSSSWVLFPDGTASAPGIGWVNEPTAGIYRSDASSFQSVVGGNWVWAWNGAGFSTNSGKSLSVGGVATFAAGVTVNGVLKATGNGVVSGGVNTHEFGSGIDWTSMAAFYHRAAGQPKGIEITYPNSVTDAQAQDFINCGHGGGGRFAVWTNGGIWNVAGNNVNASDAAIKRNIVPAPDHTAFVEGLQFKQFSYEGQDAVVDGVIAQDIEARDAALVTTVDGKLGVYDHRLQQRINSIIPKLIERIKVLEAKLGAMEAKLGAPLEARFAGH